MQKYYTEDFLTKKQVLNQGVLPQYYVEGNHEAIIAPETFELVQQELIRRKEKQGRYSGVDIFASRIVCGQCGAYYGSKVWHSNQARYRRVIFRCNRKYEGKSPSGELKGRLCESPHFTEDEIKMMFLKALNKLLSCKKEILANLNAMCEELFNTDALEEDKARLNGELVILTGMANQMIAENAHVALDQETYSRRYDETTDRYDRIKKEYDDVCAQISERLSKRSMLGEFIKTIKDQTEMITEFDSTLWGVLLDHMTVYSKEDVRFTFRDGTEIRI